MSEAEYLGAKFREMGKEVIMQAIKDCLIDEEKNNKRLPELENKKNRCTTPRELGIVFRQINLLKEMNRHKLDAVEFFKSGRYRYWLGISQYNGNAIKRFLSKNNII